MNTIIKRVRATGWAFLGVLLAITPLFAAAATNPNPVLQKPITVCVNGKPQVTVMWNKLSGTSHYSVFRLQKPQTQWLARWSRVWGVVQVDKYVVPSTTYQYQVKAHFSSGVTYSNIVSITTPPCATAPTPSPAPAPSTEKTFTAYITGYGWPDNTPPSAAISSGVIHTQAGGIGTYADPITIAVGHSIIGGKDILDYPKGTKFYIPALRKYFIVEDTCGDGAAPQNGPCHSGHNGYPWLDAWVGGQNATASLVYACENKITGLHTVIQNPASNYTVTTGPIFNNGICVSLFGETALSI